MKSVKFILRSNSTAENGLVPAKLVLDSDRGAGTQPSLAPHPSSICLLQPDILIPGILHPDFLISRYPNFRPLTSDPRPLSSAFRLPCSVVSLESCVLGLESCVLCLESCVLSLESCVLCLESVFIFRNFSLFFANFRNFVATFRNFSLLFSFFLYFSLLFTTFFLPILPNPYKLTHQPPFLPEKSV